MGLLVTDGLVTDWKKKLREANAKVKKQHQDKPGFSRTDALKGVDPVEKLPEVQEIHDTLCRQVQSWFIGRAIRRTVDTVDNTGKPIWSATPPTEQDIFVKLSDDEIGLMDETLQLAPVEELPSSTKGTVTNVSVFVFYLRRNPVASGDYTRCAPTHLHICGGTCLAACTFAARGREAVATGDCIHGGRAVAGVHWQGYAASPHAVATGD